MVIFSSQSWLTYILQVVAGAKGEVLKSSTIFVDLSISLFCIVGFGFIYLALFWCICNSDDYVFLVTWPFIVMEWRLFISFQLRFLLFFMCWVILDFILDILNITRGSRCCLNFVEIVDISVFYNQLSWLGLGYGFEPMVCGAKFQCLFSFKAFSVLFACVMCVHHPTASLRPEWWLLY